jgi:prevent-host-death family protein
MKTATITDAKNGLSALIDRVKAGESVMITDRGTPVARLEPVASNVDPDGRLLRLSRAGIVRLPEHADARQALSDAPAAPIVSESVAAALIEERRTGR